MPRSFESGVNPSTMSILANPPMLIGMLLIGIISQFTIVIMWVNNIAIAQGPLDAPLPNTDCRPGDPKCQASCKSNCHRCHHSHHHHQHGHFDNVIIHIIINTVDHFDNGSSQWKFSFQDSCSTVEEEVCSQVSPFLPLNWEKSFFSSDKIILDAVHDHNQKHFLSIFYNLFAYTALKQIGLYF